MLLPVFFYFSYHDIEVKTKKVIDHCVFIEKNNFELESNKKKLNKKNLKFLHFARGQNKQIKAGNLVAWKKSSRI